MATQGAHVIKAYTIITMCGLLLCFSKEVYGQKLYINASEITSGCSSGLRHGIDFFSFRGIVDATTGYKSSNLVMFQVQTKSSDAFLDLCIASIRSCISPNTQACYCAVAKGNIYEIILNRSADLTFSNAKIRIQWGDIFSDGNQQLPRVYDVDNVTTSLTLNEALVTCPATVTEGSVITVHCQNSPSPCDVTIALDNIDLIKSEANASYTVASSLTSHSPHNFTFTYSVCGGAVKSFTCQITAAHAKLSKGQTLEFESFLFLWCLLLLSIMLLSYKI